MSKSAKPENIAKLTEEQRRIYDIWEKEHEATVILLEKAVSALESGDQITATVCFKELDKLIPNVCEHDRSVWDRCSDCVAIEKIVYPENYDDNGNLLSDEAIYNRSLN
jgi:hypothetical protein